MPGGKAPACSTPSFASVSALAAPETLQRPELATYVSVAGRMSVSCTLVAVALPVFV